MVGFATTSKSWSGQSDVLPTNATIVGLRPRDPEAGGAGPWPWTCSKEEWRTVYGVLKILFKVASCFDYFDSRFEPCTAETLVRDGRVKPEAENSLELLDHLVADGFTAVEGLSTIEGLRLEMPNPFPHLGYVVEYLMAASDAKTHIHREIISALLVKAEEEAQILSKFIPTYDHIVNDKVLNKSLAQKHLLGDGSTRVELNSSVVKVKRLNGRLHGKFHLVPSLSDDKAFGDAVSQVQGVYALARKAITVVTGLSVVMEMTGSKQAEEGSYLLTNKRQVLPKALVTALEKVSKK